MLGTRRDFSDLAERARRRAAVNKTGDTAASTLDSAVVQEIVPLLVSYKPSSPENSAKRGGGLQTATRDAARQRWRRIASLRTEQIGHKSEPCASA